MNATRNASPIVAPTEHATPTTGTPRLVHVRQVSKDFAADDRRIRALTDVSFEVARGEIVCIVGPSGSGKSTLLRIIAGLTPPDSGTVTVAGDPVTAPHPAVGMVFQRTNLMPWRTVLDNVLLPLEIRHGSVRADDRRQAQHMLRLVGLEGFEQAYPKHLSGGMAQRAVLARTLLQAPEVVLLDEPFGALDALTRERLNLELLRLHALRRQTMLLVTHSISEAVFLGDRILVLSRRPGRIVATIPIGFAHPRDVSLLGSAEFAAATQRVRHVINQAGDSAEHIPPA